MPCGENAFCPNCATFRFPVGKGYSWQMLLRGSVILPSSLSRFYRASSPPNLVPHLPDNFCFWRRLENPRDHFDGGLPTRELGWMPPRRPAFRKPLPGQVCKFLIL